MKKTQFTDSRDGKTYKTVKIGDQWWMAENLNYETTTKCYGRQFCNCYSDIVYRQDSSYFYKDNENNCKKYGRLYFNSKYTEQNACPIGWHIPTIDEWKTLVNSFGDMKSAFVKLTNDTVLGFNLQFAGISSIYADYAWLEETGVYYAVTLSPNDNSFTFGFFEIRKKSKEIFFNNKDHPLEKIILESDCLPIRCIKDN